MINMEFTPDYDWDYIYELMCDPRINTLDQIKYSEQISMLRQEMEEVYGEHLEQVKDLQTKPYFRKIK